MSKIKSRPNQGNGFQEHLNSYGQLYGNQVRKALPPYGSQCRHIIANHQSIKRVWGRSADGQNLTLTIGVGSECWNWAAQWKKAQRPLAILPPDETPDSYDWSFSIGHDPILIQACGDFDLNQIHDLAHELLTMGVQSVIHLGGLRYMPQAVAA